MIRRCYIPRVLFSTSVCFGLNELRKTLKDRILCLQLYLRPDPPIACCRPSWIGQIIIPFGILPWPRAGSHEHYQTSHPFVYKIYTPQSTRVEDDDRVQPSLAGISVGASENVRLPHEHDMGIARLSRPSRIDEYLAKTTDQVASKARICVKYIVYISRSICSTITDC